MNDLLPDGWCLKSCRELCHVITKGTTPSSLGFDFQDSGINFIKVESINSNGIIDAGKFSFISDEANLALKRSIIFEGDILITIAGATVGKLAIARNIHLPANTNQALAIVRTNERKVFRTYLLYWLQTDYIKRSIDAIKTVGAQPNLSLAQVGGFLVNLPPLPEQQKIAQILTSVDEVIEKIQAQIDKLKDLKTAMMQELLTKGIGHVEFKDSPVGRIPVGWDVGSFDELFTLKNGVNKGKEFFGKGIPIISYRNVYDGGGIYDEQITGLVDLNEDELNRFQVKYGDLFITRTSETPEEIGYVNVYLGNRNNVVFNGFVIRARQTSEQLNPTYCKYAFQTYAMRNQMILNSKFTTRAGISGESLARLKIAIPTKNEQEKITKVLSAIDDRIDTLADNNKAKKSMKKALMQDLLTGKVRVKVS